MAIPETQLETWANQGSVTQSSSTYATIKNVLENSNTPYADRSYTSFLQGSYGNDTNIFADSDVDIVMQLESVFNHDISKLDATQQAEFHEAYNNADYGHKEFKKDVFDWLKENFVGAATPGTKAIFIKGDGNRRDADVLAAITFRQYLKFKNENDEAYVEGICFYLADGTRVENFPRMHSANMTAKHQLTKGWFKPTVRIFKNMRNKMIADNLIKEGLAPSYYLEGLLFNVPPILFGNSYDDTMVSVINWLRSEDRTKFHCANGQHPLFAVGSHVSWRADNCEKFLNSAAELWRDW